jgi:hypothetical protein
MAASSGHHGINSNLQQGSPPPCGFEERNAALLLLLATMAGQKEAHITASTNHKVEHLLKEAAPKNSSPVFLLGSASEKLNDDRSMARLTNRTGGLAAILLEIPELNLATRNSSCHQSLSVKKTRPSTYQIRP